jgi:hypothetical protein
LLLVQAWPKPLEFRRVFGQSDAPGVALLPLSTATEQTRIMEMDDFTQAA